ncbi:succinylglutamate desuccinylase/aspartoacylase domain-containing protein [Blastopirellula retiformator]|uniref:Succinylglutamate desuccinylase / Aspartoacylase family protein n=1 Tax=Blastopirellula retiformator TaxID=2527970 RepID=A0A5C5VLL3_9BACT|nr:succinylglutamate desuccinylase/aspartoacylase family protein [Blastopirellula retiformator]TWT39514.1 Succinylglutamate desuccinylase / Aspartoacylase family protein [Blastopirellula retiformator]
MQSLEFSFVEQRTYANSLDIRHLHAASSERRPARRGLVVLTPYLMKFTESELLQYYLQLADAANKPAFQIHSRNSPDGLDLARVFPGTPHGRPTEQIAFAVNELIESDDYLIDLHTGGQALNISPLVGYMLVPGEAVIEQRQMAHAFGLPIVWGTSLRLEGRSLSAARDAAMPAIYGAGVAAYVDGCLRVMTQLNMLSATAEAEEPCRCVVEDDRDASGHLQTNYPAPIAGYYEATAPIDARVAPGDELGRIFNTQRQNPTIVTATQHGRLITRRVLPAVAVGDCLAVILEFPADTESRDAWSIFTRRWLAAAMPTRK